MGLLYPLIKYCLVSYEHTKLLPSFNSAIPQINKTGSCKIFIVIAKESIVLLKSSK